MFYDLEREKRQLEAMGLGAVTKALGGNTTQETKIPKFPERSF
jgi:hypothetical protein